MYSIKSISDSEFDIWPAWLKVIVHDYSQRFAILRFHETGIELAISWRSDGVDPILVPGQSSACAWVGIDQRVACITTQGQVLFSMGLGSALLDVKVLPGMIAIVCEMELLTVNADYSIRSMNFLKDPPKKLELIGEQLMVTFPDGEVEVIR